MKISHLSFLLIALLFSSCNNTVTFDSNVDTNGLIKKIEDEDGNTIAEYTYNPDGSLKTSWNHIIYFMDGKNAEYTYTFNDNKQLIKKEGFEPGNMVLSSMTGACDKDITEEYKYDSKGRLTELTTTYDYEMDDIDYNMTLQFAYPDDQTVIQTIDDDRYDNTSETHWIYNNDGNIDEIRHFNTNDGEEKRLYSKEEYTYDDKKSPITFVPKPQSKNNILEVTYISYNYSEQGTQTIDYSYSVKYDYEYNENNYPSKQILTNPNNTQETKIYTYH